MTSNSEATRTVRQYFARLSLQGRSRAALEEWPGLPVESFFVAMSLPAHAINRGRKECGRASQSLDALFANIKWG